MRFTIGILIIFLTGVKDVCSQETNSDVSAVVRAEDGEALEGASVVIVHEPTKSLYRTRTNSKGYFHLLNVKPGGPYSVTISYTGFKTEYQTELYIEFSSGSFHSRYLQKDHQLFIMQRQVTELPTVAIKRSGIRESRVGTETNISAALMKDMPSISRNIQDYARLVPQAKMFADGGMSFAGQSNRLNAFYIDGANTMDLLGVASSGISGGQTATPPVSVDAIDEIRIMISPYDVQYGNFTGASINAITRSGTNLLKSSVWYYFRNQDMAGKSPIKDPLTGDRKKLPAFSNRTLGSWISGPIVKDKLFYFASLEWQKEDQPQPFDFSEYRGNSTEQHLIDLRDTLMTRYGYEAGEYNLSYNNIRALRYITKIDWNPSPHHKLSFTYRLNTAERQTPVTPNGSVSVRYLNNGFKIQTNTNFATLEWRSFFSSKFSNRLLVSYSDQKDDRKLLGKPFPVVLIQDGAGSIIFGPNGASQMSLFEGKDLSIVNVSKLIRGNHVWSAGVDFSFSWLDDLILSNYFGSYQYRNLSDFLSNGFPFRYQRTLLSTEQPVYEGSSNASSVFMTSRLGFFLQDEWKISPDIQFRFGMRYDGNSWNTGYPADEYFNEWAIPAISPYYDLQGARSGKVFRTNWLYQPRVELITRIAEENVVLKLGGGIFNGHILNIWASDIYNYKTVTLDVNPSVYNLRFDPDVDDQPDFSSLGLDPQRSKGNIVLVSPGFKYPAIFRMSTSISKTMGRGWNAGLELLVTKNLHEPKYTNVNILPANLTSKGPGPRAVYAANGLPARVPMNGGNPYNTVLLLANNQDRRGYSYSLSATISSPASQRSALVASYTYGYSEVLFEQTSSNLAQWRSLETINGRNNALRSVSSFDLAHRVYVYGMRKFTYAKSKISTTFSFFYQGQSGQPYSYVYGRSMVNDVGQNENFDLIYVPTNKELQDMIFVPIISSNGNYSADQQRTMLDNFIESDRYLRRIRGSFAERNKMRLPFTHSVDIRIQQEFSLKAGRKELRFGIVFDVFNFLNMLNPEWGRIYQLNGNSFPLIRFDRFTSATDLTPQYQFSFAGKPWSIQSSTAPGNSARWISQLGFRFYL